MLREEVALYAEPTDVPLEPWEVAAYRCVLPSDLMGFFGVPPNAIGISGVNLEKIQTVHVLDWPAVEQIALLLTRWEYRGISRKKNHPLELYFHVDGIWRTAVIGPPREGGRVNELVMFHRLRPSKVLNRYRRRKSNRGQKNDLRPDENVPESPLRLWRMA